MKPHRLAELATQQSEIEAATAAYFAAGGRLQVIESPIESEPTPPRRDWIDPETVLRRKRRGISAAERTQLKSMTEAL